MNEYLDKNQEYFRQIVLLHYEYVESIALTLTSNEQDAADLTLKVFLAAHSYLMNDPKLHLGKPEFWLRRETTRAFIDSHYEDIKSVALTLTSNNEQDATDLTEAACLLAFEDLMNDPILPLKEPKTWLRREVIKTFVKSHYEDIKKFAHTLTSNEQDAADVAQDVCEKVLKYLNKDGRIEKNPHAWLRSITRNTFLNMQRHTSKITSLEQNQSNDVGERDTEPMECVDTHWSTDPFQTASSNEGVQTIFNLMSELSSERVQLATILRFLGDWTISEIAERLGCPESTAKVSIYQGRRKLIDKLRQDLPVSNESE